jgi:hypothetical protein
MYTYVGCTIILRQPLSSGLLNILRDIRPLIYLISAYGHYNIFKNLRQSKKPCLTVKNNKIKHNIIQYHFFVSVVFYWFYYKLLLNLLELF